VYATLVFSADHQSDRDKRLADREALYEVLTGCRCVFLPPNFCLFEFWFELLQCFWRPPVPNGLRRQMVSIRTNHNERCEIRIVFSDSNARLKRCDSEGAFKEG